MLIKFKAQCVKEIDIQASTGPKAFTVCVLDCPNPLGNPPLQGGLANTVSYGKKPNADNLECLFTLGLTSCSMSYLWDFSEYYSLPQQHLTQNDSVPSKNSK